MEDKIIDINRLKKNLGKLIWLAVCAILSFVLLIVTLRLCVQRQLDGLAWDGVYIGLFIASNLLKLLLFILLAVMFFLALVSFIRNGLLQILILLGCLPIGLFCFVAILFSGRYVLNASRPLDPDKFFENSSAVEDLTEVSAAMISKDNVFWIGNGTKSFIFGITYKDGNYRFHSMDIPQDCNFKNPIPAEDANEITHLDLPFQPGHRTTDKKILDPNDYYFCRDVSSFIRKIGFDNIKLYREFRVVQYQIYDFYGWDGGSYYIYYFTPDGMLPEEFTYDKKLSDNWYFDIHPRF